MSVIVLHPQDSLRTNHYQPIIPHFPNMKLTNPNPKPHRNPRNRKKWADPSMQDVSGPCQARPTRSKPQLNHKHHQQSVVAGQVKILKRGQQLPQTTSDQTEIGEKVLRSTPPPLPDEVEGLYAGYSMLVLSPPPSSLPLPLFLTKKIAAVSDATSDLRKMLRLDFP